MNNLYKLLLNYKEVKLDMAILVYHKLLIYYDNEIKKGFAGLGKHYWLNFILIELNFAINLYSYRYLPPET